MLAKGRIIDLAFFLLTTSKKNLIT